MPHQCVRETLNRVKSQLPNTLSLQNEYFPFIRSKFANVCRRLVCVFSLQRDVVKGTANFTPLSRSHLIAVFLIFVLIFLIK